MVAVNGIGPCGKEFIGPEDAFKMYGIAHTAGLLSRGHQAPEETDAGYE